MCQQFHPHSHVVHLPSATFFPQINRWPIYVHWWSNHFGQMWHCTYTHTSSWKVFFRHLQPLCPQEPFPAQSSSFWPHATSFHLRYLTYSWTHLFLCVRCIIHAIPSPTAHFTTPHYLQQLLPPNPLPPLYSPLAILALNILFMDLPQAPGWGGAFLTKTMVLMSVRANCTEAD